MARKRRRRLKAPDGAVVTPRFRLRLVESLVLVGILGVGAGIFFLLKGGVTGRGLLGGLVLGVAAVAMGAAGLFLEGLVELPFMVTPGDAPETRPVRIKQRLLTCGVVLGLVVGLFAVGFILALIAGALA